MNLSAPFVPEFFGEQLKDALPYVDILFGNADEADAFAKVNNIKTKDRKVIALALSNFPKINEKRKRIVVITQGSEPVVLAKDGEITEFPVTKLPEEKVVDTNGAGDAFVGGKISFFYRQLTDESVECTFFKGADLVRISKKSIFFPFWDFEFV